MASILPGYEYDIFISYRQNDNKRDAWVTNFVEALKDELEATLKNPISIYFDVNPHDGLLESHQVAASLEKKLKCLVFIPIISQTYCDTESFAWQHEFLPFYKMASGDELGMNVTLAGGNVASRVLPIKIHDLDVDDQHIIEKELGGPIRSIDFIYKEPGVNRPLGPNDNEEKNLNQTLYKNQINKVANALKEIGNALTKAGDPSLDKELSNAETKTFALGQDKTSNKSSKFVAAFILIPFIVAVLYFLSNSFIDSSQADDKVEKSIAVLPFVNISNDPEQEYFSDGLSEELINILAKTEGIQIVGRTSSFSFKGGDETLTEIGEELGVNYILEGSVRKVGNTMRITAQLIRADNGFQMWSETYDREYTAENIFNIYDEISMKVLHELELKLDPEELLSKPLPTESSEAFNNFLKATQLEASRLPKDLEAAINYYKKAIEIDGSFSLAYARLAITYSLLGSYGNISGEEMQVFMNENIQKALIINPEEPYVYIAMAILQHDEGNYEEAIAAAKKAVLLNPNFAEAHVRLHNYLYFHGTIKEQAEAKDHLDKALELEPKSAVMLNTLALSFVLNDKYEMALQFLDSAIKEAPEFTDSYIMKADIYGDPPYGQLGKAFISLHKAYLKEPENFSLLRGLLYYALDLNMVNYAKFINDKLVELYPENSNYYLSNYAIELLSGNYDAALIYLYNNGKPIPERDKENDFMFYLDIYNLLNRPDEAVSLTERLYPEFIGDSIIINDETLFLAFEVATMYENAGLHNQANKIRKAFYEFKEVPSGKINITDSTSWWIAGIYMNRLLMDGNSDELLSLFRKDFFEGNEKSDVYVERLSIAGQSLKQSLSYQPLIDDIDKEISKMRGEVVSYLIELQMWNDEWEY